MLSFHVLCFCETWLPKEVQNSELKLGDYQIYTADRPPETDVSPHGGPLIAVKNTLDSKKLDTALHDCCIACIIKLAQSEINICVFYNPPEGRKYTYTIEDFEAIVNGFPKTKQPSYAVMLTSPNLTRELL